MGARGPQPTPTATLKARGSWRANEREGEPQYAPGDARCPPELKGEAKKEWQRIAKKLVAAGVYADVDRAVLIAYVEAWEEYRWCSKQIAEKGFAVERGGYTVPNPLIKVRRHACERLVQLAGHFGMTPSTRSRVKAMEIPKAETGGGPKTLKYFQGGDEDGEG